jgi:hypothetical protein
MKVTFIIKKAAKRYDTESMATIYVRFRNGRQLDSVAPTQLAINPNLWDDKDECVKTKAVCNEEMRTHINEEIRQLKTYIEKVYQQEKEAIDKEWLKTTLDKFYHPEKYFLPEEVVIKPTIYNPQIHPFVFSKRNVRLWRGVPKTKRSIFEKIQMPFKQLSKSL